MRNIVVNNTEKVKIAAFSIYHKEWIILKHLVAYGTPCRNFSNFFLKMTRSAISVHVLVLVSMRKYILNHK